MKRPKNPIEIHRRDLGDPKNPQPKLRLVIDVDRFKELDYVKEHFLSNKPNKLFMIELNEVLKTDQPKEYELLSWAYATDTHPCAPSYPVRECYISPEGFVASVKEDEPS